MKLTLDLRRSAAGAPFGPEDRVRGTLEVRGAVFQRPPRITATFKGTVTAWVSPQVNGPSPGQLMHTLFEETRQIEHKALSVSPDEAGGRVYAYPVEFRFPSGTSCCGSAKACQLPPSTDIEESGISIRAEYGLTVHVDRHVFGPVTRRASVTRELPFSCNPLATSPPPASSSHIAALPVDKLSQASVLSSAPAADALLGSGGLPAYSPSLQVQVLLPQPPVLVRGRATPVGLIVHTPAGLLQTDYLYIRSVAMNLRTTVTAGLGPAPRSVVQTRHGCSMTGAVRIDKQRFELESGVWGNFFVLNSRPTCESCVLTMAHSIDIITGISVGLGSDIQYVWASLEVLVMDPPPAYEVEGPGHG